MAPGCAGVGVTDTLKVRAALDPHELLAVTETVPPIEPALAVMEFVVELPVHPEGSVHV